MKRPGRDAGSMLFTTDFLKPARRAFSYAVMLAKASGARLVILHVIEGVSDGGAPVSSGNRYLRPLHTAAMLELGRLVRLAEEAGIPAEPRLEIGDPATSVIETMAHLNAPQLIVMGTQGRAGWDRLKLGSMAESVIRKASCPVVTVPGIVAGDALRSSRHVRWSRLLLATDFSACAHQALLHAAAWARRFESRMLIVHAVEASRPRSHGGPCGAGRSAEPAAGLDRARQRLDRLLSELEAEGLTGEGRCLEGRPIDIILEQAARWQADAIVIGTQGRRGLRRLMLGSVAEQVVRRAGCPVVTLNRSAAQRLMRKDRDGERD